MDNMQTDIITSAKNPIIKRIKKLFTSGKYRRQEGLAIAEGVHLATSLLATDISPQTVVYAESSLTNPEIKELMRQLDASSATKLVVKDSLFESLSGIHASVGVLVVFSSDTSDSPTELSSDSLLLEDIQDPGNLGTILRTAVAAGVKSVYLSPDSASAWSPKVLRAGMGAQFSLDIYENINLAEVIKSSDISVLATDLSADKSIYDVEFADNSVWLFGNEGQGVSQELLELCTERVTIPQAKSTVESLNVSAAVAVCLFEQRRQQKLATQIKSAHTAEEKKEQNKR